MRSQSIWQADLLPAEPTGLSPDLLADLADWRTNLDTRTFTALSVDLLLRDLRRTVPSALGYTLVLGTAAGLPQVAITFMDDLPESGPVLSTIRFGLPVAREVIARVTFYAAEVYAFDQLATLIDDSALFGSEHVELGGRPDVEVESGVQGLADHTKVNYAIGVLLSRGRTFDEADRHLQRLANRFGTLEAAAEHLLTTFNA